MMTEDVFAGLDLPVHDTGSLVQLQAKILADAKSLSPDEIGTETILARTAWFPYRRLDPFERTLEFVRAFDGAMFRRADSIMTSAGGKRFQRYLKLGDLHAPWVERTRATSKEARRGITLKLSSKWKYWVAARRLADIRGYSYDDYIHAAIDATIKRGWPAMQAHLLCDPRLLGGRDGFESATIPALITEKYAGQIRWCDDPYFQAQAFTGDPLQLAYFRFIAFELVRLHGRSQRSSRAFTAYQRDGRIAVALDLDNLLS